MKKRLFSLLLAALMCAAIGISAVADTSVITKTVTFEANGRMGGDLASGAISFEDLEPGDERDFTVVMQNRHARTTRWYMRNEVIRSLERSAVDRLAAEGITGGAYSYLLTYQGPSGSKTLYDSNHIGGDDSDIGSTVGLEGATGNLEDYFYIDTLNSGESGRIELIVSLEGETQGNDYQNTAAVLDMQFAVELADGGTSGSYTPAVKTGDENNLTPYYIGMIIAGLLFLYLALDALTDRLYKKGVD